MSEFQREFFEELWYDTTTNDTKSVLYEYLREEKNAQIPAALKILEYDELLGNDISEKRAILEQTKEYQEWEKTAKKVKQTARKNRKKARENPCVNVICKYYDFKIKKLTLEQASKTKELVVLQNDFIDEIKTNLEEETKIAKNAKKKPLKAILNAKTDSNEAVLEDAMNQVIGAYLSVDAKQFMYDIGYPLTTDPEVSKEKRSKRVPVKRMPVKLMDLYFRRKNLSLDGTGFNAELVCEKAKLEGEIYDEFEQVYNYVKENRMTRAVVPLLIDNQSGSGLYILGEEYLAGWKKGTQEWEKVQEILTIRSKKSRTKNLLFDTRHKEGSQSKKHSVNRSMQSKKGETKILPCCYAIVKFMNLNVYDKNEWSNEAIYYWAPYSIASSMEDTGIDNVDEVIFSNLQFALDCYYGQLKTEPNGIESDLYEYFRDVNIVNKDSDWQSIPKRFRKFFDMSDEYFERELELEREEEERVYNEYAIEERTPNRRNMIGNNNLLDYKKGKKQL